MVRLHRLNESTAGESVPQLRAELQNIMQNYFGVFRKGNFMQEGIKKLEELRERIANVHLKDKSSTFNTARIEALELEIYLKSLRLQQLLLKQELKVVGLTRVMILGSVMMKTGCVILCIFLLTNQLVSG
jgi:hypothetical protein